MKVFFSYFFLMSLTMTTATASQTSIPDCKKPVYSHSILTIVNSLISTRLNRYETAYTPGISVQNYSTPQLCYFVGSGRSAEMVLGTYVTASLWGEEGDLGVSTSTCYISLAKDSYNRWIVPTYMRCEYFAVEEDY